MPTTYARPPAKNPPTIHENITGIPKPPKNPVLAGSTASMPSIAGPEINLSKIIPTTIIPEIK